MNRRSFFARLVGTFAAFIPASWLARFTPPRREPTIMITVDAETVLRDLRAAQKAASRLSHSHYVMHPDVAREVGIDVDAIPDD